MLLTRKSWVLGALALAALSACATQQVPDSGAGVGFSDFTQYEIERARREAQLRGTAEATAPTSGPIVPPTAAAGGDGAISSSELAAAGINTGTAEPAPATTTPAPIGSNPGISDEQNFDAVASRETIESDAQRREAQAAAYTVIEATDLPERTGSTGPNIVQFALNAPNNRGQSIYTRTGLSGESRFQRNCAKYNNPDEAQRDFLSKGGPERDRLGIDPDGDGFACGWDPTPFRALAQGN